MDHKTGLGRLYRNVTPYMGSMGFRGLFLIPQLAVHSTDLYLERDSKQARDKKGI